MADSPIGDLLARLKLNTTDFQKGIRSADSSVRVLGGSLRALAGIALPVGIGATLAAGLKRAATAAAQFEQSMARNAAILRATGNSAGLTLRQLDEIGRRLDRVSLAQASEIREATGALLTFKNVVGDTFERTLVLAQDLASAGFGQLTSNVRQLGKVSEDPIKGLTALGRLGIKLTPQLQEQAKAFVEAGEGMKAFTLVLDALEGKVGGAGAAEGTGIIGAWDELMDRFDHFVERSPAIRAALDLVAGGILGLADALPDVLDAPDELKDVGRQIAEAAAELQRLQAKPLQLGRPGAVAATKALLTGELDPAEQERLRLEALKERAAEEEKIQLRIQKLTAQQIALVDELTERVTLGDEAKAAAAKRAQEAADVLTKSELAALKRQEEAREKIQETTEALTLQAAVLEGQAAATKEGEAALVAFNAQVEMNATVVKIATEAAEVYSGEALVAIVQNATAAAEKIRVLTIQMAASERVEREREKAAEEASRRFEEEAKASAEAFAEPFRNAFQDMQTTFTDTFESMLSGGVDSWKDFWGELKSIAFRFLANIFSKVVFDGLAGSFISQLSGISSGGGGPAAGGGGGGGVGGFFNIFSSLFGSSASGARQFGKQVGFGIFDAAKSTGGTFGSISGPALQAAMRQAGSPIVGGGGGAASGGGGGFLNFLGSLFGGGGGGGGFGSLTSLFGGGTILVELAQSLGLTIGNAITSATGGVIMGPLTASGAGSSALGGSLASAFGSVTNSLAAISAGIIAGNKLEGLLGASNGTKLENIFGMLGKIAGGIVGAIFGGQAGAFVGGALGGFPFLGQVQVHQQILAGRSVFEAPNRFQSINRGLTTGAFEGPTGIVVGAVIGALKFNKLDLDILIGTAKSIEELLAKGIQGDVGTTAQGPFGFLGPLGAGTGGDISGFSLKQAVDQLVEVDKVLAQLLSPADLAKVQAITLGNIGISNPGGGSEKLVGQRIASILNAIGTFPVETFQKLQLTVSDPLGQLERTAELLAARKEIQLMIDTIKGIPLVVTEAEQRFAELEVILADIAARGPAVGINEDIVALRAAGRATLRAAFEADVQTAILAFTNPLELTLRELAKAQEARLREAEKHGANLVEIERLTGLERAAAIKQAFAPIDALLKELRIGIGIQTQAEVAATTEADFRALASTVSAGGFVDPSELADAARLFLDASRTINASSTAFFADLALVQSVLTLARSNIPVPGFASGGSFAIPGSGHDNVVPLFRVSGGESVAISSRGQGAKSQGTLEEIRAELYAMNEGRSADRRLMVALVEATTRNQNEIARLARKAGSGRK